MSDDFHEGDTFDVEQPGGYDQLPTAVWMGGAKNGAAAPGDVVAYLALRRFGTMRKGAIPSREVLADDMGITVRAVDDRLNGLIEGGWLLITPRFRTDGQGQTSNHYQLFWEPITHQDDPRLVEHRRRVAEFEAWMASRVASKADSDRPEGKRQRSVRAASWDAEAAAKRQVYWGRRKLRGGNAAGQDGAKETARGGEGNFHPGAKETARAGAKETAPLEPHPYGVEAHRSEPRSTTPAAAGAPSGRLSATVVGSTGTAAGQEVALFGEPEVPTQPVPPAKREPEPTFADFWAKWPKKLDKGHAETAWAQMLKKGARPSEIIAGLDRFNEKLKRDPIDPQYIPYPATWLRGKRYEDSDEEMVASVHLPAHVMEKRAMHQSWLAQAERMDAQVEQRWAAGGSA